MMRYLAAVRERPNAEANMFKFDNEGKRDEFVDYVREEFDYEVITSEGEYYGKDE